MVENSVQKGVGVACHEGYFELCDRLIDSGKVARKPAMTIHTAFLRVEALCRIWPAHHNGFLP